MQKNQSYFTYLGRGRLLKVRCIWNGFGSTHGLEVQIFIEGISPLWFFRLGSFLAIDAVLSCQVRAEDVVLVIVIRLHSMLLTFIGIFRRWFLVKLLLLGSIPLVSAVVTFGIIVAIDVNSLFDNDLVVVIAGRLHERGS